MSAATTDSDPDETQEWLDSVDGLFASGTANRATYVLGRVLDSARQQGAGGGLGVMTDYVNTIAPAGGVAIPTRNRPESSRTVALLDVPPLSMPTTTDAAVKLTGRRSYGSEYGSDVAPNHPVSRPCRLSFEAAPGSLAKKVDSTRKSPTLCCARWQLPPEMKPQVTFGLEEAHGPYA